jgi:hypothetical protein
VNSYRELAESIHIYACPCCDGTEALAGGDTPYCATAECEAEEMYPVPQSVVLAVLVAANAVRTPVECPPTP